MKLFLIKNNNFSDMKGGDSEIKTFDYSLILKYLKHDKTNIEKSISEFLNIINSSLKIITNASKNEDLEKLRPWFHDLLNLNSYYGADYLNSLITEYKEKKHLKEKTKLLNEINDELKAVKLFYENITFKELT